MLPVPALLALVVGAAGAAGAAGAGVVLTCASPAALFTLLAGVALLAAGLGVVLLRRVEPPTDPGPRATGP